MLNQYDIPGPRNIANDIAKELLEDYKAFRLSSRELSEKTGFHAAAIRRAIKRPPREAQPKNKTALIEARRAYRASIAHLQPKEIRELAHVSLSTANRIRTMRLQ